MALRRSIIEEGRTCDLYQTLWDRLLDIWCLVYISSFWQSGGQPTFSVAISMPNSIRKENGKVSGGTKVPSVLELIP